MSFPRKTGGVCFSVVQIFQRLWRRTTVFFYGTASVLVAELIAPALSSILIKTDYGRRLYWALSLKDFLL